MPWLQKVNYALQYESLEPLFGFFCFCLFLAYWQINILKAVCLVGWHFTSVGDQVTTGHMARVQQAVFESDPKPFAACHQPLSLSLVLSLHTFLSIFTAPLSNKGNNAQKVMKKNNKCSNNTDLGLTSSTSTSFQLRSIYV